METATLLLLAIFHDMEMTQFWSINNICQVCKLKFLFFKIMDNIYIDRLLLVAFAKYFLQICGHCIRNCTFRDVRFWTLCKLP